ncbi:MAG: hypothetical protein SFU83_22645 [Meiothermus sp.]|nr:hypothetical protein [Meiothermus sp.]
MNTSTRPSYGFAVWVWLLTGLFVLGAAWFLFWVFHRSNTAITAFVAPAAVALRRPALPNPALTPGDVLITDVRTVCVPGYAQTVRGVPEAVKQQVYAEYGIASHRPGEYAVDHLISLELGGSNSIRNLWPESYLSKPLNAHVKDVLERKLHDLVCAGRLSIQTAQQAIAQNWPEAYQKYVGPLPSR